MYYLYALRGPVDRHSPGYPRGTGGGQVPQVKGQHFFFFFFFFNLSVHDVIGWCMHAFWGQHF